MPPKRSVKSTSRKTTPVSPPKAVSGASTSRQTRRNTRAANRGDQERAQPERGSIELSLQPVAEEEEDDSVEVPEGAADTDEPQSSTDSVDSDSQGELDALDYDFIVESLADLHRESSMIIRFFDNPAVENLPELWNALQDPFSRPGKRFRQLLSKYIVTRESFGGRLYILPSIITQKLRDGEAWTNVSDGKWRPDAILYLANLAQLLATAFVGTEAQTGENLRSLFHLYPHVFTSSELSSRFATKDVEQATRFANAFRTRLFVSHTRERMREVDYDPNVVLNELFFDEEGKPCGIELAGPEGDMVTKLVEDRIRDIKTFVSTNSKQPVKLDKLDKTFSRTYFASEAVDWAVTRSRELFTQIEAQGGVDSIVNYTREKDFSLLNDPGQRQTGDKQIPIDPQLIQDTGLTKKRQLKGLSGLVLEREIARLKDLKTKKAARHATTGASGSAGRDRRDQEIPQTPAPTEPDLPLNDRPPPPDNEAVLAPSQMTNFIEQTLAQHARESNKENANAGASRQRSFLDRQHDARKVPFSNSQEGVRKGPVKHRREAVESDEGEFEEDRRPTKQVQAAKGKGKGKGKEPALADEDEPGFEVIAGASTQPPRPPLRPKQIYRPPPSSAPARVQNYDDDVPRSTQYAQVNAEAKRLVELNRERNYYQKLQVRRAWTTEEVQRLMELIELNGPKYAKILADDKDQEIFPDGPELQHRNQVQLKDKARNIKLDYLKARQELPPGFANVSIGARHTEILRENFGIDYIEGDARGSNLVRD